MIKIAVCDDNPYELEEVAEKIKIYLDQQETALQTVVQTFQCGEYLIMEIRENPGTRMKPGVPAQGANQFTTHLPLLQRQDGP